MSTLIPRFIFVFLLVVNCVLWSQGRYGQPIRSSLLHGDASLVKRISYELSQPQESRALAFSEHECRPLAFPIDSQCQHIDADCPPTDTVLDIDYLHHYYCTEATLRPLVFTGLLLWLIFLFSTLGISASDFFTPNLATISQLLGLDENVAGVTFLAFGNGSPDVFSTFSAMRANSGSLAIGELIGAATFIVSCVVGSMCIIKPFEVHRFPFLRDVGFFTLAVSLVLVILWDGKISAWEAGTLVLTYVIYVAVVVGGSLSDRKKKDDLHNHLRTSVSQEPYLDEPPLSPGRVRAISAPDLPHHLPRLDVNNLTQNSQPPSPTSSHVAQLPSFSLVGALEFRDVVASLKKQAAGPSLSIFENPLTPYAGGHYHAHFPRSRSPSLQSSMDEETLIGLQRTRSPVDSRPSSGTRTEPRDLLSVDPQDYFSTHHTPPHTIPPILRTPASLHSSTSDASSIEPLYIPPNTKPLSFLGVLGQTCHILFPTLHNFRQQTFLSQIACILAAPAVLCLTLTLPVVVTPYESGRFAPEKLHNTDTRLPEFEEEGVERTLFAEQEVQDNLHQLSFNKWLMAAQCVLGPLFCVRVLFGGTQHQYWYFLGTLITGTALGILVVIFAEQATSQAARLTRCSMGFFVSVVWIMAIADEVVTVLQTFGLMFGLSDAIIGLTIFAVGNSLADLVANMSVAAFAPIMGFSACFGGPMLNILLGVGVSGTFIIHQTGQPYILNLSHTLFVSTFGLLFLLAATLIFVPQNDYVLTQRWGTLLIATYTVIMIINVIVELKS